MFYGAIVTVKVIDVHHRRSPLVQGELEIPIQVTVKMTCSAENKDAMATYEELIHKQYKEPVDGIFEDVTREVLKHLESDIYMY